MDAGEGTRLIEKDHGELQPRMVILLGIMYMSVLRLRPLSFTIAALLACLTLGCVEKRAWRAEPSPTAAGLNTRDLIDVEAQAESERLADSPGWAKIAERLRVAVTPEVLPPKKTTLCLSGGGVYGAYTAGILCGWTSRGDRPTFDVVTGISTGALIAPYAFLGPQHDETLKQFITTLETKDIFKRHPIRGLLSESLADTSPLERTLDKMITRELMMEIAQEHQKGRRLYIGTTELEGRRFVFWDIGAIASRGTEEDRALIKLVLLGSSAIPGLFPPASIPVRVGGRTFVEKHIDGGVSQGVFLRPAYVPPELENEPGSRLRFGSDVYVIIAGKLYADPEPVKPLAFRIAGKSISTVLYAQTRGDLTRMWTICQMTGMNFYMTAIPAEYPAPLSSTEFKPDVQIGMFNEGIRQVSNGTVWRKTPPGAEPGEPPLARTGTDLTYQRRGPESRSGSPSFDFVIPVTPEGIPVPAKPIAK